jgi:hypothetical protein
LLLYLVQQLGAQVVPGRVRELEPRLLAMVLEPEVGAAQQHGQGGHERELGERPVESQRFQEARPLALGRVDDADEGETLKKV